MAKKPKQASVDVVAMLQQIRDAFLAEFPSRLEDLESQILEMKSSEAFRENYHNVYGNVHSIKGSAGTHGLDIFTTICHAFEDEIIEVDESQSHLDEEQTSKWLSFIDLLRQALNFVHDKVEDFSEIENAMEVLRGKGKDFEFEALLVVENEIYKQLCASAFENHSVKYSHVSTGYQAIGRLLKQPFDLLVTNMELPDLQGNAVISAIKMSHSRNNSISSVLLTSSHGGSVGRLSDPNYIVKKDADMLQNLNSAIGNIISNLK